jgi:hypothetical protein
VTGRSPVTGYGVLKYDEWEDRDSNAKRSKHYIKVDQLVYGARDAAASAPAVASAAQVTGPPRSGGPSVPQPIAQSMPTAPVAPVAAAPVAQPILHGPAPAGAAISGPPATSDDIPF